MGDSADTARERQAAKKVPKKKKAKPFVSTPDSRAFAAATSIFVPPELQNEHKGKPKPTPPRSVVFKPTKPKPETVPQKRKRQAAETKQRERAQLGLKITGPTGRNNLDAVPEYRKPPSKRISLLGGALSVPRYIPGTHIQFEDVGRGVGQVAKHGATAAAHTIEDWAGDIKDIPGNTVRSIIEQSYAGAKGSPRRPTPIPVPQTVRGIGAIASQSEPLVRPIGKTAGFLATEKGQEEIWGKSLVNLVLHGDIPKGKGEYAGMTLGALGILPIGKLTQLAKLGRAAKALGKLEPLADTEARTAWRAVLSQRLGVEAADEAMIALDNAARNLAKGGKLDDPLDFYAKTEARASNIDEFLKTPAAKTALFQTGAGPRSGLIAGISRWVDNPVGDFIPGAGDHVRIPQGGGVGLIEDMHGTTATIRLESGKTVQHYVGDTVPVIPDTSAEVPVFKTPDLIAQVEALPPEGLPRYQMEAQFTNAIKPAEMENSGMKAFFDQYPAGEKIPKADLQSHLATSLNAYNLDEVVRISTSKEHPTRFGSTSRFQGTLTAKDETAAEPYYEITMQLRTPLRSRVRRGVMGESKVQASYTGKGQRHWLSTDVVGHIRFHIFVDADGKKVLLVDEMQSDWASEWRTMKSLGGTDGAKAKLAEMQKRIDDISAEIQRMEHEPHAYEDPHVQVYELEKEGNKLISERDDLRNFIEGVPGPPPLGEKQIEALVRRTLRFAHDADVDRIVVVQGDVQALRNTAFTKTPRGRVVDLHNEAQGTEELEKQAKAWREDIQGMTKEQIRAYTNDPAHQEGGKVKTFFRLYGDRAQKGSIPKTFEKEMGVEGTVKEGAFHGGYADQIGVVRRANDVDRIFNGKSYTVDPDFPYGTLPKQGTIVSNEEGVGRLVSLNEQTRRAMVRFDDGVKEVMIDELDPMIPSQGSVQPHGPMDGFVIEMTPGAKAKAAEPMAYYQTAPDYGNLPKGAVELFADGTQVLHLFEGADISTVFHELAHISLADLNDVDRAILGRHFDFSTRAGNEAYARAMERYLYEGMAMTSELDGVFGKIKTWMQGVYRHVNQIGAHVHPEVKQVFDRLMVEHETPAQQLVRMLQDAPKVRRAQEIGYSEERSRRIAAFMETWDANAEGGEDAFRVAMSELKGTLPKEGFTALDDLTDEAISSLLETIRKHPGVRGYEKVRAADAILKAKAGAVPTRSELALLEKIFGKSVGFRKVNKPGLGRVFVEIWNIPRSFSASLDLSAPLRQGLVAGARHPLIFKRNLKPMVKALRVKNYEDVGEDIANRPFYGLYQRAKLAVETSATDPALANREDNFYSSYADAIPGIKHTSNAYTAFLHKMRADIFDHMIVTAQKKNVEIDDDFLEGLGKYVNSITGRGVLPKNELIDAERAAPLLNTLFFSPRLLASRLNMISPRYYYVLWKHDPFIAKQAMRATLHTVGGAITVLGVASQMPGVTVGLDPTSSNFGKIRIGDTRIDILAGFGPLMVLIARETMQKTTSSSTGESKDLSGEFGQSSPKDVLYRFGESKFAPMTSILKDIGDRKTFIGEDVTWKTEGKNFIPMMWRDAYETGKSTDDPTMKAVATAATVVLGGLGLGFATYPDKAAKASGGGGGSSDSGSLLDDLPVDSSGGGSLLDELPAGGDEGSLLDEMPGG